LKRVVFSVGGYYLSARPMPSYVDLQRVHCFVFYGPVLIALLDAKDGGIELAVEVEGGCQFGGRGGVERVDVVGEEADGIVGESGEREVGIAGGCGVGDVGWGWCVAWFGQGRAKACGR
jgi:hypothetical protein